MTDDTPLDRDQIQSAYTSLNLLGLNSHNLNAKKLARAAKITLAQGNYTDDRIRTMFELVIQSPNPRRALKDLLDTLEYTLTED